MTLILANDVRKTYRLGRVDVPVLKGATASIERGEWVALLGASGSGKSTLLHLLGGLDRPDRNTRNNGNGAGEVVFDGRALTSMSARELDRYRSESVGFIFQFYHLLPELTVLENSQLGAMIQHGRFGWMKRRRNERARATELLDRFGLGERLRHRPAELSGGERQRVAIARALMNEPALLLADEPTGNLDRATGGRILDALAAYHTELGQTIVMVTHDEEVANRAERILRLADGVVEEG